MKSIGIIPARSGSKGVKDKNILEIGGKPLLQYTIESSKDSRLDKIFLSTDSEEYKKISNGTRVSCPELRPKHLASDSALTVDVVRYVVDYLSKRGENFDVVILLQPTCPLRSSEQINTVLDILNRNKEIDSVVSVVDVEGNHPFRMKRIENNRLINFIDQGFEDLRPRQVLPKIYLRSGTIYAIRTEALLKYNSMVGKEVFPLVENSSDYVNIDTVEDVYILKNKLKERNSK
jgi:CMP-N,N'-diacetyllegionaminic acid synthase